MRNIAKFLVLTIVFFISNSCNEQLEIITDCLGQSAKAEIKYSLDTVNAKKINFSLKYKYEGTGNLISITWIFGDGTTETTTDIKVTHTYETVGNYEVKADMKFRINSSTDCNTTPKKVVTVN